jgi:hypothetical protein
MCQMDSFEDQIDTDRPISLFKCDMQVTPPIYNTLIFFYSRPYIYKLLIFQ